MQTDSPGVPASASAYELFRGFSFVAPALLMDEDGSSSPKDVPCVHKSIKPWSGFQSKVHRFNQAEHFTIEGKNP